MNKPCFRQGRGLSGGLAAQYALLKAVWPRSWCFEVIFTLQSQHWFIGFSVHSLSELKALNPLQGPTDNITSLSGQGAHSWIQHCGHRSQFCLQTLHWKPLWMWPKLNSAHKLLGVAYSIFSLQFIGKLIVMHSHYIMKCNVEIFHEGYLNRVWKPDEQ